MKTKLGQQRDIDFLLDAPEDEAINICQKFRGFGYTAHLRMGKSTDDVPIYIRLISDTYPQVDLIYATRLWEKKIIQAGKMIDDFKIKLASIEDLIVLKVVAGSEVDILDIKNLISCCSESLDFDTINNKLLGIDDKFIGCLKNITSQID